MARSVAEERRFDRLVALSGRLPEQFAPKKPRRDPREIREALSDEAARARREAADQLMRRKQ